MATFKGYRITSNFGYRIHPISKVRKLHAGVDLVKNHNDPIHAFVNGKVSFAGRNHQGFGNLVIVNESNGYRHFYAHLNSVNVRTGQQVTTNTVIGRQGATGNVTGSHLHYEVRNGNNKPVDPMQYINGKKGSQRVVNRVYVDGYRGKATITRWQQFLGTPQDGVLWKTSAAIKQWQRFLNKYGNSKLTVDGIEGKGTIKATQKFFGTPKDGKISRPSIMVKELQRFLNGYGQ